MAPGSLRNAAGPGAGLFKVRELFSCWILSFGRWLGLSLDAQSQALSVLELACHDIHFSAIPGDEQVTLLCSLGCVTVKSTYVAACQASFHCQPCWVCCRWRYGLWPDGKSLGLSEVGAAYGLTQERIRQIEESGLARLRERSPAHLKNALAGSLG